MNAPRVCNSTSPSSLHSAHFAGQHDGTGLFPWWLDQHEQPQELVDDANVVLLGKTLVRRRQVVPAVSRQQTVLERQVVPTVSEQHAAAMVAERQKPGLGNGLGGGSGASLRAAWQDGQEPDVKAQVCHYAVLIQCLHDPRSVCQGR